MTPIRLLPVYQKVVDSINSADPAKLTDEELSAVIMNALPPPNIAKISELSGMVEEKKHVTEDGVNLTITRPLSAGSQVLPAILYLHGGGWVYGDDKLFKHIRLELTLRAYAAVVFVNYSLSPAVTHPVALEECYTALSWIADTDPSIHHLDSTKISVAGDSAGGNLTAALAILDKQRHGANTRIQSQVLVYPVTHAKFDTESYRLFGRGYFLTTEDMEHVYKCYAPEDHERLTCSTVSPLVATLDELTGLPPALVITAEADVLRDEGEAYARRLIEAGVSVVATRVLGAIHGFWTTDPSSSVSESTFDQIVDFMNRQWGIRKKV